jgi:hypothetical protein
MPINYTYDVDYDPFMYTYSLSIFYADSDDLVIEYHGLEDVNEVIRLLKSFDITPDDNMIIYMNDLKCDDTAYYFNDAYDEYFWD